MYIAFTTSKQQFLYTSILIICFALKLEMNCAHQRFSDAYSVRGISSGQMHSPIAAGIWNTNGERIYGSKDIHNSDDLDVFISHALDLQKFLMVIIHIANEIAFQNTKCELSSEI